MVEFVIIDQLVPKEHLLRKVYAENLTVQPLVRLRVQCSLGKSP